MYKKQTMWGLGVSFWVFVVFIAWTPLAFAGNILATSTPQFTDVLICIRDDLPGQYYALLPTTAYPGSGNYQFPYAGDGLYYYSDINGEFESFDSSANYVSSNASFSDCQFDISVLVLSGNAYDLGVSSTTSSTSSVATSSQTTVDNPNQDFANGVWFFLAGMFGMMWFFSKKR